MWKKNVDNPVLILFCSFGLGLYFMIWTRPLDFPTLWQQWGKGPLLFSVSQCSSAQSQVHKESFGMNWNAACKPGLAKYISIQPFSCTCSICAPLKRRKHQIREARWGDCKAPQMNTQSKYECHIYITFPTWCFIVWGFANTIFNVILLSTLLAM